MSCKMRRMGYKTLLIPHPLIPLHNPKINYSVLKNVNMCSKEYEVDRRFFKGEIFSGRNESVLFNH